MSAFIVTSADIPNIFDSFRFGRYFFYNLREPTEPYENRAEFTKCILRKRRNRIFFPKVLTNDDVVFAVSDEDKEIASSHQKFLNTEFAWDKNSLSQADIASGVPCLIHKEMVRESVNVMKNGKAAGRSVVMWEVVFTA